MAGKTADKLMLSAIVVGIIAIVMMLAEKIRQLLS